MLTCNSCHANHEPDNVDLDPCQGGPFSHRFECPDCEATQYVNPGGDENVREALDVDGRTADEAMQEAMQEMREAKNEALEDELERLREERDRIETELEKVAPEGPGNVQSVEDFGEENELREQLDHLNTAEAKLLERLDTPLDERGDRRPYGWLHELYEGSGESVEFNPNPGGPGASFLD